MAIISLLDLLFKSKPKAQAVLIWTKNNKISRYYTTTKDAEKEALQLSKTTDVYFGCCTVSGDFAAIKANAKKRATMSEVVGCGGLFVDLDYGDSHAKKNIPPTEQDAISLLMRMPAQPSVIVSSGNGLHAYWLFEEFQVFTNDEKRNVIQKLNEDWQRKLQKLAADFEWTVDSTYNLDRVLRVPDTLNHKSNPPKQVNVLQHHDKRYSVKDLQEYVAGNKVDAPTRRYRTGAVVAPSNSDIILNENATYNAVKFQALCAEEPRFKQSFERTRKGMKDTSPSSYDMSLATFAANAGWTDQEIVDLLIVSRKIHKDDLKLREDYYARTLLRARTTARVDAEQEIVAEAANAPITDDRHENLKNVSDALGIEVSRFIKYTGDTPTYILYLSHGHEITFIGAEALQNQRVFAKLVIEKTDVPPNTLKTKEWNNTTRLLLASVDVIETGGETQQLDIVSSMLAHYLTEKYNDKDDTESQTNRLAELQPAKHSGEVYFNLSQFIGYMNTRYNEKRNRNALAVIMKRMESEEKKISIRVNSGGSSRVTSRFVWKVPTRTMELYKELGGYEVSTDDDGSKPS